jgi:antitoxin component HigA of HigAB toxin-antitoxin module
MNTNITLADMPKNYAGLLCMHTPRTLHNEAEYDATMELVDCMAGHELTLDQDDYLDLLTKLVAAYSDKTCPPDSPASGLDILKYLMEEHGLNGAGLASILHVSRAAAYRLLNGQRRLTADHIKALAEYFGVSADLFLGTSGTGKKRSVVAA